jgi:hypothetical protein
MAKDQYMGYILIRLKIVSITTIFNVKLEKKNSFIKKLRNGKILLMTC